MNFGRTAEKEKRELTGTGRGFPPKLLQKGALGLCYCILEAFGGLLFLDLVRLLLNRESVLNTRKCRQEERGFLQRLRRLFWFVPLLQTSGPRNVLELRSLRGAGR
jgi:hypothetical protein